MSQHKFSIVSLKLEEDVSKNRSEINESYKEMRNSSTWSWILQKLNSKVEIKFGKFFQNPQKKDKEIKLMRETTSDKEDRQKKNPICIYQEF